VQAPYSTVVVPHERPVVDRTQPEVSHSVTVLLPHPDAWQTASVRVRLRLPLTLQVLV